MQLAGLLNLGDITGLQVGLVSIAKAGRGLQVGLHNQCKSLSGLQIGLANVIRQSPLPFCPIENAHF